jgi:hypothetical protein
MLMEQMRGDPADQFPAPPETLDLTEEQTKKIDQITSAPVPRGAPEKDPRTLFLDFVLPAAGKEADAGISRSTNKQRVTEYLNLFGLNFADPNGHPYAYCAAGLSWVACEGYCQMDPRVAFGNPPTMDFRRVVPSIKQFYFLPHPSCLNIVAYSKTAGNWIDRSTVPLPGWLVFYNWSGGGTAEHVGIVESSSTSTLRTIEFNTSIPAGGNQSDGGAVARKNRDEARKFVIGYVATHSKPVA